MLTLVFTLIALTGVLAIAFASPDRHAVTVAGHVAAAFGIIGIGTANLSGGLLVPLAAAFAAAALVAVAALLASRSRQN